MPLRPAENTIFSLHSTIFTEPTCSTQPAYSGSVRRAQQQSISVPSLALSADSIPDPPYFVDSGPRLKGGKMLQNTGQETHRAHNMAQKWHVLKRVARQLAAVGGLSATPWRPPSDTESVGNRSVVGQRPATGGSQARLQIFVPRAPLSRENASNHATARPQSPQKWPQNGMC